MLSVVLPVDDEAINQEAYQFTDAAGGVLFDMNGDGVAELTAWTHEASGVGFLAMDRNNNGVIDNGKELFGSATHSGQWNGFIALAHEADRTVNVRNLGSVELGHPLFQQLLIWIDRNHNGVSESDELERFSDHYVSFGLSYGPQTLVGRHGNRSRFKGEAVRRVGESSRAPETPVKCGEAGCFSDRSEELSRIVPIHEVCLGR